MLLFFVLHLMLLQSELATVINRATCARLTLKLNTESPTDCRRGKSTVLAAGTTLPNTTMCAAENLCEIQAQPMDGTHKCLNCDKYMHGGVCGLLWAERGPNCVVNVVCVGA